MRDSPGEKSPVAAGDQRSQGTKSRSESALFRGAKHFGTPLFLPTHPPRDGVVALRPSPNPSPPSSALSIGDDVAVVLSSGRRVAIGGAERQSNDFFRFREAPRDGCPRSSNIFTGIILRASDGWPREDWTVPGDCIEERM